MNGQNIAKPKAIGSDLWEGNNPGLKNWKALIIVAKSLKELRGI